MRTSSVIHLPNTRINMPHYTDSLVRHTPSTDELQRFEKIYRAFSFESLNGDLVVQLNNHDIEQVALVLSLLLFKGSISMGMVKAYALRFNIPLDTVGFTGILNILSELGLLVVKSENEVTFYYGNISSIQNLITES